MALQANILPSHSVKALGAMKAERTVKRITFNPTEANPGNRLYVSVPKLNEDSSMIKGVLGQPNFSPPNKRNTIIQNFLFLFHRKFKLVPFVQLNTTRYVCVNFNG